MGMPEAGSNVYRYRFQSGGFYLIREEYSKINRVTGEGELISINYLTGQKIVTTGNLVENTNVKTEKEKFKKKTLRLLGAFKMGWGNNL